MSWSLGTRTGGPADGSGTSGSILVWALVFSVIASAMILSHSTYLAANRREMDVRYEHATLADSSARSGLTDALAWYQRQQTQPVTAFAPMLDPEGDPPLWDTIDPTIGLVREFEVRGSLWARYEVRHEEVVDISPERGIEAPGSVWDVGARGYIYRRVDPEMPFDSAPNQLLATTGVRAEMRGIALLPPAQAAVSVEQLGQLELGPNAELDGAGGPALAYPQGGLLTTVLDATLTGSPSLVSILQFKAAPDSVFSMHLNQLRSLSDVVIEAAETDAAAPAGGSGGDGSSAGALAPPPPQDVVRALVDSLARLQTQRYAAGTGNDATRLATRPIVNKAIFAEGGLTIIGGQGLAGRALLVVRGDLVAQAGSRVDLDGVVYVTGDATLDGSFQLDGTLIVRGKLRAGYGDGRVLVRYSPCAIAMLKKALERYRLSRALRPAR